MWKENLNMWVLICVFIMTFSGYSRAVTYYVYENDSIQAAIDLASDGDEIEVEGGNEHFGAVFYSEAIDFKGKAIRLYSSSGPYYTGIYGNGAYHVVQCISGEGTNTIIEGFTITGGNAQGSEGPDFNGGGMLNIGSSPTVTNCIFSGNQADYGGGMYNGYGSNPTVTNCNFNNNTAGFWGAGMFNGQSSPIVTNCKFLSNEAGWDGGGMFNGQSNPTVTDCDFTDNIATYSGGGIYSKEGSSPSLTDCTFSGNMASDGGGIYNCEGSSPSLTDCTFSGNTASDGGGIYNGQSSPTVINCIFSDNRGEYGGGISNLDDSNSTIINCTFRNNGANHAGGGIRNFESSPTITNSIFSGNSAGDYGGGIFSYYGSLTVTNCTFSQNTAIIHYGGGMCFDGGSQTVTNCILWGNTAPSNAQIYGGNPIVNYSDVEGGFTGPPPGNIDADPCFVDAAVGDLRLSSSDSACVDAGSNGVPGLAATDLAGDPRIADGDRDGTAIVDMGAFELPLREIRNVTQDIFYGYIQAAVNYSNYGDQIEVGPGTYNEAINFGGKAVRLYSSGGAEVTTIDGNGAYHVVQCISGEDADTILEGFTITGGNATGDGGFIYNHTYNGGGMYNYQSSPTITNCTFIGNTAIYYGGGMYNSENSNPEVTNCTFNGNTALEGGGMSNLESSPTVTNCTLSGNTASVGGGMYNLESSATVTNCTFSGNTASYVGGMSNYASNPTVTNCIIWGNTPIDGQIIDGNPTVNYSNVQGTYPGIGNINDDPCFVDAQNPDPNLWNLRLKPDSPCIDAGDTTAVYLPLDLDVNPRAIDHPHVPNSGRSIFDSLHVVDIGAYEFQPCRISGDNNCDGVVDFKDLAILCENWLAGTEPE